MVLLTFVKNLRSIKRQVPFGHPSLTMKLNYRVASSNRQYYCSLNLKKNNFDFHLLRWKNIFALYHFRFISAVSCEVWDHAQMTSAKLSGFSSPPLSVPNPHSLPLDRNQPSPPPPSLLTSFVKAPPCSIAERCVFQKC